MVAIVRAESRPLSTGMWSVALVWLLLVVAAQSFFFWLPLPYDQTVDQDTILAYNGLLLNSGLPQEYFDHTGYGFFLLIWPWFWLLHAVGLLPVASLEAIPADSGGFQVAWEQIIADGRALTALIMAVFAVSFALLTARLFANRLIGFLGGLAVATAAGTISQIGIIRTEPLSALMAALAVLFVAVAAQGRWRAGRFLLLGAAAFAGVVAVLAKVFGFLPLLALPLLALAFGAPYASDPEGIARRRAVVLVIAAIVVAIPAGALVWTGLTHVDEAKFAYKPLGFGPLAYYQALFAIWILAGVAAYAALWRVPLLDSISAVAAVVIGTGLGLTMLFIRYDLQNVIAATHPLEHLFVFSTWTDPSLNEQSSVLGTHIFSKLAGELWSVLSMRVVEPVSDNAFLLDWFVVLSLPFALRDRDRKWAAQAALLLAISIAMQATFLLRYENKTYHIYSDAFTILAAMVVVARFRSILANWFGVAAVTAGAAAFAVWGVAAGAALSDQPAASRANLCKARDNYLAQLTILPFCEEDL